MCEPPLTREKLLQNARYLCRERPIRYAKRVKLFQRLPFIVNSNPFINEVYRMYYRNFEESRGFPMVETLEDHEAFIQMLTRHSDTLKHIMPQIARGFFETRMYFGTRARQTFLDQLISMRISLRLLTSQHIALHNGYTNGACHSVIDRIVLGDTVRACAQGVQTMCEMSYDSAPDFEVDGDAAAFHYIEPHLEYMVVELLKNAFRSSLQAGQDGEIPRVLITVSKGNGKVAIRIRDHGGGIPRRIHDKIFDYAFTTVEHQDSADPAASETRAAEPPFAGLGFGLPMTKLYAEYFGGSLHIVSLEGYGCDAFLELPSIKVDRVPAITI
ncbi:branched-chain alpha-ketoacid dehydrogenase [Coemansia spiralis]|nr:branched-chain alpha-ketoacid dehydrogenase [Coemansia spiralis]